MLLSNSNVEWKKKEKGKLRRQSQYYRSTVKEVKYIPITTWNKVYCVIRQFHALIVLLKKEIGLGLRGWKTNELWYVITCFHLGALSLPSVHITINNEAQTMLECLCILCLWIFQWTYDQVFLIIFYVLFLNWNEILSFY